MRSRSWQGAGPFIKVKAAAAIRQALSKAVANLPNRHAIGHPAERRAGSSAASATSAAAANSKPRHIRAFRNADDHRVRRPVSREILFQHAAQPPRFRPYDWIRFGVVTSIAPVHLPPRSRFPSSAKSRRSACFPPRTAKTRQSASCARSFDEASAGRADGERVPLPGFA